MGNELNRFTTGGIGRRSATTESNDEPNLEMGLQSVKVPTPPFTKDRRRRSATTESNDESNNLEMDITQLRIGTAISQSPNTTIYEGSYKCSPVAIKVIQKEQGTNVSPERKEQFQREVKFLSKVQHDNIVKFIGATMDPALTLVTELMKGGSLQRHLWNIRPFSLDQKDALIFALEISRAMEHLHDNGIMHCNLRPGNIFLSESKKSVKLGDFGLCREGVEGDLAAEVGSRRWMAPEVFKQYQVIEFGRLRKKYNHKLDVYSFSIVLWELLTNKTPFAGKEDNMIADAVANNNERPSLNEISGDIRSLLTSCWANDPEERPEFRQIAQILEEKLSSISPSWARTDEISLSDSEEGESTRLLGNAAKKIRKSLNLCCCLGWITCFLS